MRSNQLSYLAIVRSNLPIAIGMSYLALCPP
jgi:hypothetical protein